MSKTNHYVKAWDYLQSKSESERIRIIKEYWLRKDKGLIPKRWNLFIYIQKYYIKKEEEIKH